MKEMKTLTINGVTYTVTDPDAASIDDSKVGTAAWSSKNIVDKLCPAFTESGAIVTCEPVEGYPLEVAARNKNLLPYPYSTNGIASSMGIAITSNDDGSVTFNGTATNGFYFFLQNKLTEASLPAGIYCISAAGCSGLNVQVEGQKDGVYVKTIKDGEGSFAVDYSTYDTVRIFLFCASGTTVNETIYPQLELGSEATGYVPPNVALTITRCGKNLLNITAESTTLNGVTFTVNADGSVTASGTATANTNFPLATMTLPAGDYILSGCPSGGGFSTYMVFIQTGSEAVYATGTSKAFSSTDGTASRKVLINIQRNVTVTDLVFYPMIRAAALNKDYEPYNGGTFAPGDTIPALPGVNTLWAEAGQITVTGRTNPTYTGTEAGGTENVI